MPRQMRAEARTWVPFVLVGAAAAWLASTISATGEWDTDTWPRIQALTHGNVTEFFRVESMMGPFAPVVQAPFAAISGGGALVAYRWSAFACLLAVGLLGLYLAHSPGAAACRTLGQALIAGLCLFNPLTIGALDKGHPEELLTAALAVAAIATASEGHRYRAAPAAGPGGRVEAVGGDRDPARPDGAPLVPDPGCARRRRDRRRPHPSWH